MKIIELDAGSWTTVSDFYGSILPAIGAPEWHGHVPVALADSMIGGGVNSVQPPYTVRILNTANLPDAVETEILKAVAAIDSWNAARKARTGEDVEVNVSLIAGPT